MAADHQRRWNRPHCPYVVIGVAGLAACNPGLRPQLQLIQPYTYALESAEPFDRPFLAHFRKGSKELLYVAAFHENAVGSQTFELIDRAFDTVDVRIVLIEGTPASRGVSPADLLESFRRTSTEDFHQAGEASYAALRAADRGISFIGGEPDDAAILVYMTEQGYQPEDLVCFYFVRQIRQYEREGSLDRQPLEALYRQFVQFIAPGLGLQPQHLPFDAFLEWYATHNGKPFLLDTFDPEEAAPVVDGPRFTQRMSHFVGMARDRFMVSLIARLLNEHDRVMVVFGKSHLAQQRPALEQMLGQPVVQQAL